MKPRQIAIAHGGESGTKTIESRAAD
jgi:hypothetical protein